MIGTILTSVVIIIVVIIAIFRLLVIRGGRGVEIQDPASFLIEQVNLQAVANRAENGDVKICWDRPNSVHLLRKDLGKEDELDMGKLSGETEATDTNPNRLNRYLYSIQFEKGPQTSCALRTWDLPGIINLRDLGGYKTSDGFLTAWGKIYRTGHLAGATDDSLQILNEYGIQLVCDLRSLRERTENPDKVPESARYLETSIYEEDQLSAIFPKLLFNRASLGDQLAAGYIRMLDERPTRFAEIIGLVANNLPAMFHCTAGKDRAGLTAAMILSLLGVPRETVISDYALSNLASDDLFHDFMSSSAATIGRFGIPPEQLRPLFAADPRWMRDALNHLDINYGGVEPYLLNQGGLSPDAIKVLRAEMLVQA